MSKREYREKLVVQKLIGIAIIVLTMIYTAVSKDVTGPILLVPLGIYLISTEECWIY